MSTPYDRERPPMPTAAELEEFNRGTKRARKYAGVDIGRERHHCPCGRYTRDPDGICRVCRKKEES